MSTAYNRGKKRRRESAHKKGHITPPGQHKRRLTFSEKIQLMFRAAQGS